MYGNIACIAKLELFTLLWFANFLQAVDNSWRRGAAEKLVTGLSLQMRLHAPFLTGGQGDDG